eukprot:TRINITY_DN10362_c0_g1_i2.p1 TRINITY_DN10362_c0_g1~~TRINITY_DN10362_c0_g1_i2.p1  ORF type:complete len:527 (+),score=79.62 TRINITY_DN10362_c0_g1_i2:20-1600(+)
MPRILLVFLLVATVAIGTAHAWDIRHHLDTKTPYWIQQNSSDWTPPPDKCFPVHFNLVARHGSRQPTKGDTKQMVNLQALIQKNKDAITNPKYQWMKTWVNPYIPQDAGYLVYAGEEEHYQLAKRFMQHYPTLFNETYEPSRYPIRSTQVSRAGRSANSFSFGVFEGKGKVGDCHYDPFFITATSNSLDDELRFFSICPKYRREVADNETAAIESTKYMNKILPGIAANMTKEINAANWTLSGLDAQNIFKACQFQASIDNITDQFCALITETFADQFNYLGDLSSYWEKGYGFPIDYTIACPLMTSFVDAIDSTIAAPVDIHSERANLRFGHAETVMPFIALLGIYKDKTPLKADSPADFIKDHLWRGTVLAPYASNIAWITYNCTAATNDATDYRVRMLVSEKEIPFPGCEAADRSGTKGVYCPLSAVKKLYAPALSCNFTKMCDIPPCLTPTPRPKSGDDDSDSEWNLNAKGGIVVIVIAIAFGALLGMVVLGGGWGLARYLQRKKQWKGYGILGDTDTQAVL